MEQEVVVSWINENKTKSCTCELGGDGVGER